MQRMSKAVKEYLEKRSGESRRRIKPRRPYGMIKTKQGNMMIGPGITWLWKEPTTFEAAICLNEAYANGYRAGVRAISSRRRGKG